MSNLISLWMGGPLWAKADFGSIEPLTIPVILAVVYLEHHPVAHNWL